MGAGLSVRGLEKRFGEVIALDGLDLDVAPGSIVGFLGSNGAGKTTSMRGVMGMVSLDGGTIEWDGAPITHEERKRIGYMPQERGMYPRMKVGEHVAYFGRLAGLDKATAAARAEAWIERVGLSDRMDDAIQDLSTGNQQRVQLSMAMVHEPDLFLLDEPFAGLDPMAVEVLIEVMQSQLDRGASVVFSSHQLGVVQDLTDTVTVIARGRTVASGTVSELRAASPKRLMRVEWADDTAWNPPEGVRTDGGQQRWAEFEFPATADAAALITAASAAGPVLSLSYDPPGLDDVFIDLVTP